MRKILLSIFLIGFLFNTFHDFVFYFFDDCMSKVETAVKFEKGEKNDPLCKIHHELHEAYLYSFSSDFAQPFFEETYSFVYQKPILKPPLSEIFKPPKLS